MIKSYLAGRVDRKLISRGRDYGISSLLLTLESTHNNQQHADQTHTSFELMHGKAPLAIPTSFENTKFPSVAEKIKNLVTSQEEALAAHELARS